MLITKTLTCIAPSKRSKTTIFILIHLASLDTEKRLLALLTLYLYTLLIFLHIKMALLVSVKDNFTSATCSYPTFQPLTPITTLRVKKHANLHSCIQWRTLTNFQNSFTVGFSKKFAIKQLSCFLPHRYLSYVCCYTTLQNLKCYFYNLTRISYFSNMLLTQQQLPAVCKIYCDIVSCLSSSKTMSAHWVHTDPRCQCLPFQPFEMVNTHIHFIGPTAPTPRSETSELQNLYRKAVQGLPRKIS